MWVAQRVHKGEPCNYCSPSAPHTATDDTHTQQHRHAQNKNTHTDTQHKEQSASEQRIKNNLLCDNTHTKNAHTNFVCPLLFRTCGRGLNRNFMGLRPPGGQFMIVYYIPISSPCCAPCGDDVAGRGAGQILFFKSF